MDYPMELETELTLADGTHLFVRPIKPGDEPLLERLFYSLSKHTVRMRFHASISALSHEQLQQLCDIDYVRQMALIALANENGNEMIVAVARYAMNEGTTTAEGAVVVRDDWQGQGIGTTLFLRLIEVAKQRGVTGFTAEVLTENEVVVRLLRKSGYPAEWKWMGSAYHITYNFDKGPPARGGEHV